MKAKQQNGAIYISAAELFDGIFGTSKYYHQDKLGLPDFVEGRAKLFSLERINDYLLTYDYQSSGTDGYCDFMKAGGMNAVYQQVTGEATDQFQVVDCDGSQAAKEVEELRAQIYSLESQLSDAEKDLKAEKQRFAGEVAAFEQDKQSAAFAISELQDRAEKLAELGQEQEGLAKQYLEAFNAAAEEIKYLKDALADKEAELKTATDKACKAEDDAVAKADEMKAMQAELADVKAALHKTKEKLKQTEIQLDGEGVAYRKLEHELWQMKNSGVKDMLSSKKAMLLASIAATAIFLPFTVMALKEYVAIEAATVIGQAFIWALCAFIAMAWDFSILLFAVNGKKKLAGMGSIFQFIFISAKFDFWSHYISLFGGDGMLVQKLIVITAIVIYSPMLVYQFAELATAEEE